MDNVNKVKLGLVFAGQGNSVMKGLLAISGNSAHDQYPIDVFHRHSPFIFL